MVYNVRDKSTIETIICDVSSYFKILERFDKYLMHAIHVNVNISSYVGS